MPGKKLYFGNLKYSVTNEQLQELCAGYGEVVNVNIIEGKGFGFVEFAEEEAAERAKEALNGSDYEDRVMRVADARPPQKRERNDRYDRNRRF